MYKYFLLVYILIIGNTNYAQLVFEENFEYPTGPFCGDTIVWRYMGTGCAEIIDENLSYPAYPSTSGNSLYITRFNGRKFYKTDTVKINNSIYLFFLINCKIPPVSTPGNANLIMHTDGHKKYVVAIASYNNYYNVGIGVGDAVPAYSAKQLVYDSTYLIGVKYKALSSNETEMKLWLNPEINSSEPPADHVYRTSEAPIKTILLLYIRQESASPSAVLDGIRLATTWLDGAMPVEMHAFTALQIMDHVQLRWETKTEINNYGFEVERQSRRGEWIKLGFIEGAGNSNSCRNYSFTDSGLTSTGNYNYRLKQIDNDGSFEYTNIIFVFYSAKEDPNLFSIFPNPSNSSAVIEFSLTYDSDITIELYNVLGESVLTIYKGPMEKGTHQIKFEPGPLNSGIYICRIKDARSYQSQKLIILK